MKFAGGIYEAKALRVILSNEQRASRTAPKTLL